MKAHLEITLSGSAIPTFDPVGATVRYGLNMIPFAVVDLTAAHLALLCDFDKYRRTSATLRINTINGCIVFNGLIDGLSPSQSPGAIQAQMVIKHSFQLLNEVYPRIPGFHPTSLDVLKRTAVINGDDLDSDTGMATTIQISSALAVGDKNGGVRANLLQFFLAAWVATVKAQISLKLFSGVRQELGDLAQVANAFVKVKYPIALGLLNNIVTTYTDGLAINGSDAVVNNFVLSEIIHNSGSLWEGMLRNLNSMGAGIVIGNNKAYFIPESGFLNFPHSSNIGKRVSSSQPNTAFPSDYNGYSFNDSGYKDVAAVYVVADENCTQLNVGLTSSIGHYTDPNARGGILAISLPQFVALGLDWSVLQNNTPMWKGVRDRVVNTGPVADYNNIAKAYHETAAQKNQDWADTIRQKFSDNWAQLKYCQQKYSDRTGSINCIFNPNWAPGAIGSLYTRSPGTIISFFVTDITHRFNMSPPNAGEATTSVQFNCGRVGQTVESSGLDKLELYDFDYTKSFSFANDFISDITS